MVLCFVMWVNLLPYLDSVSLSSILVDYNGNQINSRSSLIDAWKCYSFSFFTIKADAVTPTTCGFINMGPLHTRYVTNTNYTKTTCSGS